MHPALHQENLRRLPPRMRLAATAAMSANRTVQDVERLSTHVGTATRSHMMLALPALYSNLDPAEIPALDGFDIAAPSSDAKSAISRASLCLNHLYQIAMPEGIGLDLWPRVWPWVRFFHTYLPDLPTPQPTDEGKFCIAFITFAATLAVEPEPCALVVSTPWFWFILARAWTILPTVGPSKRMEAFRNFWPFLTKQQLVEPANLEELIDGAGGKLDDVARMVVSFLDTLVSEQDAATELEAYSVCVSFIFLDLVEPALADSVEPDQTPGRLGRFERALLSHDIMRALIGVLLLLSNSVTGYTGWVLDKSLSRLMLLFTTSAGYGKLAEALGDGLLRALLMCSQSIYATDVSRHMKFYFIELLPPSLVYHRVLDAIAVALDKFALIGTDTFKQSAIYDMWRPFVVLLRKRLEICGAFLAHETSSSRACDNLQCVKIDTKKAFRRCTGCQSFYYCSKACQIEDWRNGGHRETCESYGSILLSGRNSDDLTARQRSFMRTLVHYDYQKAKIEILAQQLVFLNAHPGQRFLVEYRYTTGAVEITLTPIAALEGNQALCSLQLDPGWNPILARAAASSGRMAIDVITIMSARGPRSFVVPLRTNSSVAHDMMQLLASRWSTDAPILDKQRLLEEFLTADPNAVEIH